MGDVLNLDLLLQAKAQGMEAFDQASSKLGGLGTAALAAGTVVGGALVAATVQATQKAAQFQESLTGLVTGAGEAKSNLDLVSNGLLNMAGQVGVSANSLAQGMYMVESAGYHGAQGLTVLKAAAEGAKVGNADMATVANAVTSALNAYHQPASDAVGITNELVATVASGKMHMQDLAGALGNILPTASAAGISLSQVGAAIATMTGQGMNADRAATDLQGLLMALQAPTATQTSEMQQLGLNANQLSQDMGKEGLTGTMQAMMDALQSKMGPSGQIVVQSLKAASSSTTKLQSATSGLTSTQQTYVGALSNMVGGIRGLQAALQLTGGNMATFQKNAASIADAAHRGGSNVEGWAEVQGDFNFKMQQLKAGLDAASIKLGQTFLPLVSSIAGVLTSSVLPAFNGFLGGLESLGGKAATAVQGLFANVQQAAKDFQVGSVGGGTAGGVSAFLQALGISPDMASQVGSIVAQVVATVQSLVSNFQKSWPAIQKGVGDFLSVFGKIITTVGPPLIQIALDVGKVALAIGKFVGLAPILGGIAAAVAVWKGYQLALNIQMGVMKAMGLVEFIGQLITQFGIARDTEGTWEAVQWALNAAMDANPIMLIVIAVAALIAIIVLVITHWSQVEAILSVVWDKMKQFGSWLGSEFVKAWDAVSSKVGAFFSTLGTKVHDGITSIGDWLKDHWLQILEAALLILPGGFLVDLAILFATHFTQIKATVTKIAGDVASFIETWGGRLVQACELPLEILRAIFLTAWQLIKVLVTDALDAIGSFLQSHFGKQISAVEDFFTETYDRYRTGYNRVKDAVVSVATDIENWVRSWELRIESFIEQRLDYLGSIFLGAWSLFKQYVITPLTDVEAWVKSWETRVETFFVSRFEYLEALVLGAWTNFVQTIEKWALVIESWLTDWWNREVTGWTNLFDRAKSIVLGAWQTLSQTFTSWGSTIEGWIGGWRDRVVGVVQDLSSKIGSIAGGIASNLKSGFVDGVKAIQGVFDGLFDAIGKLPGLGSVASTWKSNIDSIKGLAGGGSLGAVAYGGTLLPVGRVGPGFMSNGPRAIVGEGDPKHPEFVIPTDPTHRDNAAKLWHQAGGQMGFLESGGVLLGGAIQALASGGTVQLLDAGGLVSGSGAGGSAAGVGGYGGQCEVWVEQVEGVHFNTADAAGMVSYINSHTPSVGEIFVSTIPPDGHTGIVVGANTVEDSNWKLDGIVRVHALSDIPDIAGYINLGMGLPNGVSGNSSGGGLGGLLGALISGPEGAANAAMKALGGWQGAMGAGILSQLESGLNGLTSGGTTATSGTSAQVSQWIQSAEAMAGVGSDWTQGLSIIIDHESGGNPSATNNYDVNAAAGNASVGLMQLTGTNRARYTPPGMSQTDPVAEIVAGIKYIEATYGSIGNVPGVRSVLSGGPYLAYDSGGMLQPGLSTVFNGTGSPEPVLTGPQWDAVQQGQGAAGDGQIAQILTEILEALQGAGGGVTVHNYGQTANDPVAQARELGWVLQTQG